MSIDLNQPQVAAAIVAGSVAAVVSLVVAGLNQLSLRSMHRQRIVADHTLAERKFTFDKQLAEHKAKLDADLAERKFTFDREFAVWRRRFEVAEQVLAAAFEARDALNWARTRVIFSGEGRTRVATEPESDKIKKARDQAFIPIERLTEHAKAFAALQTVQDAVAAHLGPQGVQPITEILKAHHSITSAAHHLIMYVSWNEDPKAAEGLHPFRQEIWGERPDDKDKKVDAAIEQLNAICKPILSVGAPA
jgi:hypothetical protein